jgi:hypothetical protein
MHIGSLYRFGSTRAVLMGAAALTFSCLGAVGAGSANASTSGTHDAGRSGQDTYTCDTVTVTGVEGAGSNLPGSLIIKGMGNCVPSHGAPATGYDFNFVLMVQRSGGTTYGCEGLYVGETIANAPASVQSLYCFLYS